MIRAICGNTAIVAIGIYALVVTASHVHANPENATDNFSDKMVLVFLDAEVRVPSFILTNADVVPVNGEDFLRGTGADTQRGRDWARGRAIRVSWKRVTGYILFTKREYQEYIHSVNSKP